MRSSHLFEGWLCRGTVYVMVYSNDDLKMLTTNCFAFRRNLERALFILGFEVFNYIYEKSLMGLKSGHCIYSRRILPTFVKDDTI